MNLSLREGYAADFQVGSDMHALSLFHLSLYAPMRARSAWSAASRWTATSSLFGKDIHSLDAGLPYPYNAPDEKVFGLAPHPTSAFATAFQEAQMTTALRTQLGDHWPLGTEGAAGQWQKSARW
ncbi:hypothetical protein K438DRAFT_452169 [Mycena galopus ATCC 62051]|nr:hypothetical protein K438DRAFT_452169 [Mycena galopus ATCC 62051]